MGTEATAPEHEEQTASEEAHRIIKQYSLAAAGVCLVPLPPVNLVALIGLQLTMARRLAGLYSVPFKENVARSLITSLVGLGATTVAFRVGGQVVTSTLAVSAADGLHCPTQRMPPM